ncbi:hypothetical protein [Candidatus Laterigemmans baculatus]|uniref:hypothetical protein n=1 Tax=Candidatus Laterigemmans baculatus TaxID=2770505 RepID=UPI0013DC55D4|nr:hypothetical protein [Candidatus Laterigemmans baculatus]
MAQLQRISKSHSAITGATEPAGIRVAYEYRKDRFVFVRQKEFNHATTRNSGESNLEYLVRMRREFVDLALQCRQQRFYTADEINRLYAAFSLYKQINPTATSYTISDERMGVGYSETLSGYIVGDVEVPATASAEIERAVNSNFNEAGPVSEAMYPAVTVRIDVEARTATINGVTLSATDFRDLLLAIGGRGAMLDFEGYTASGARRLRYGTRERSRRRHRDPVLIQLRNGRSGPIVRWQLNRGVRTDRSFPSESAPLASQVSAGNGTPTRIAIRFRCPSSGKRS